MKKRVISTLAALLLATSANTAVAKTVIKLATIAPANTPWTDYMERWKNNVLKASNGEIEIQIFPSSQLGNEHDVYKQVKRGRVDVSLSTAHVFSADTPEVALMSTPFLFDKTSTIDCVLDGELGKEFIRLIEAKGMKFIAWQEVGWVHIYAKDDLSDVIKTKGYKVRISPVDPSRFLWSTLGANGVELTFTETATAMQTGKVRAAEIVPVSYVALGLAKAAPHFIKTGHIHLAAALSMSNKMWNSMSADQQKIVMDGLPPVQEVRETLRKMNAFLLNKYAKSGGPVHELTPEQRAAWKAKFEPNWPKYVEMLGDGAKKIWPKLLAAKKACSK